MAQLNLIYASNLDDTITLLWHISEDLQYFKSLTSPSEGKTSFIIMGNTTYQSLPKNLPNRTYIVLSRQTNPFEKVISSLQLSNPTHQYWVIGGKQTYQLFEPLVDNIYHTLINCHDSEYKLPETLVKYRFDRKYFTQVMGVNTTGFDKILNRTITLYNTVYTRNDLICPSNSIEEPYRLILQKCLSAPLRATRNANTYSYFADQIRFDLRQGFPLLTTKKMFFRGIVEELLWFISGCTNSKILETKGVNIWKGNSSSQFLQHVKLPYDEGDIGPMYGYQWRYFDAEYKGATFDYEGQGYDQLTKVINEIITNPNSRRMIMTTFNPKQVDQGVLYPCHSLVIQFYLENNYISLQMYQRSADVFLGLPFNIASMSLLLIIICDFVSKKTGTTYHPKEVIIALGDVHLYEQHLVQAKMQLKRLPLVSPRLLVNERIVEQIDQYRYEDFKLENYYAWENIKAEMIA